MVNIAPGSQAQLIKDDNGSTLKPIAQKMDCQIIKNAITKAQQTSEEIATKMKGEKHTPEIQKRLHELTKVLQDSPFSNEKELTPST